MSLTSKLEKLCAERASNSESFGGNPITDVDNAPCMKTAKKEDTPRGWGPITREEFEDFFVLSYRDNLIRQRLFDEIESYRRTVCKNIKGFKELLYNKGYNVRAYYTLLFYLLESNKITPKQKAVLPLLDKALVLCKEAVDTLQPVGAFERDCKRLFKPFKLKKAVPIEPCKVPYTSFLKCLVLEQVLKLEIFFDEQVLSKALDETFDTEYINSFSEWKETYTELQTVLTENGLPTRLADTFSIPCPKKYLQLQTPNTTIGDAVSFQYRFHEDLKTLKDVVAGIQAITPTAPILKHLAKIPSDTPTECMCIKEVTGKYFINYTLGIEQTLESFMHILSKLTHHEIQSLDIFQSVNSSTPLLKVGPVEYAEANFGMFMGDAQVEQALEESMAGKVLCLTPDGRTYYVLVSKLIPYKELVKEDTSQVHTF